MAITPTSPLIQSIANSARSAAVRPAEPARPADPVRPAQGPEQVKAAEPARAAAPANTQKVTQAPATPRPDLPRGSLVDILV